MGRVQGALRELESERGSQQRPGQVRRFPEKLADGARPACREGRNRLPHGARRARGWGPHPPQPGSQWGRLRGSRGQSGQAGAGPRSRREGWARVVLATARLPGQLPPGPAPRGCSRNTASKLTSRGSRASGGTPPLLPCLGLGQPPAPSWAGVSRLLRMVSGRLRAADRAGAREGHPIADSGHLHHGVRTEVRVCRQTSSANRPGARPGHSRGRRSLEPLGDVSARPRPQDSAAQCPRAGGPITAPKNEPAARVSARHPPGCCTPGH